MRFIDRLFPFTSVEMFKQNTLPSVWVIISIIIFLIAFVYLFLSYRTIKKHLHLLSTSTRLRSIWESYKNTFFNYGNGDKTVESADGYLNEPNVIYTLVNYRILSNVSSTLVGFGILGTFVGLTYGIADTNFESTETIKSSISHLLSGMGIAFVTSIWGMGLSILFTIFFKYWQTSVSNLIDTHCFELDKNNIIKQVELEAYRKENQKEVINELFNEYLVAETEGGRQLPKNVFRQLLDESTKQTAALQTFADDLGDNISIAIENLVESNNNQIGKLIEQKLVPVLEDLKTIKQDSGTKVVENAVENLANSMKSMMEDFKSTLTNDTKNEMEVLIKRVATVSEALIDVPNSMKNITLQVTDIVNALKDTVNESINQNRIQSEEMSKQNKETFTLATQEYKTTFTALQNNMETLATIQTNNIEQVSELTNEIKSILTENGHVSQQFNNLIQKIAGVVDLMDGTSSVLRNNTNTLSSTSENFKKSIEQYAASINEYVVRNENLLTSQKEALEKTRVIANEYGIRFETIKEGLSGIFDQIQTGLIDYKKTTADVLNQYLTSFSTTLTKAHEGLENTVSGLAEINEELSEQIDKLVTIHE